jgi:hypothetical protein
VFLGVIACGHTLEIAEFVVVEIAIDMVDMPAGRYLPPSIEPYLSMKARAASIAKHDLRWIVVTAPIVATIDNTAIFNDLDHVILPTGVVWQERSAKATSPRPLITILWSGVPSKILPSDKVTITVWLIPDL